MSRWMDKKDTDRYECGIVNYLDDKGSIERLVKFQWGYEAAVALRDEDNTHYYTFEYQGEDQFAVQYKYVDFEDTSYDGDGFGPEYTVRCGFITIK